MKILFQIVLLVAIITSSCQTLTSRKVEDFNFGWSFHLGDIEGAENPDYNSSGWRILDLPHDWSIELPYDTVNTGSSTGFLPGGIGWYRKSFKISPDDKKYLIRIEFDGIYDNSRVWLNGKLLGYRPNGYVSFSYDLTNLLKFDGTPNVIAIKVDHSAYIDSRWYTGSGIYRNVRLVRTNQVYIPQWGIQISTSKVSGDTAEIFVRTNLENKTGTSENIDFRITVFDSGGVKVYSTQKTQELLSEGVISDRFFILKPEIWDIEHPNLYTLKAELLKGNKVIDDNMQSFGIRTFRFDANKGFFLNGRNLKLKGANLHHDAGAVGSAVPKDVWERRLIKLKSIGCNAIRTSHNPVSPEFLDLCDKLGFLVIGEFFDEWNNPKSKSLVSMGDNRAPYEATKGYNEHFDQWAEHDLKATIFRDFNHPSIILWSIGNEVEWTYPYYSKAYDIINGKQEYYKFTPSYDSLKVRIALNKLCGNTDTLLMTAQRLAGWVRETDTSRPVTCGNVHPSIGLASGYGQCVDVLGFNYRAVEYDAAHKRYPDLKIYGSENWGTWPEWKSCIDRDFVAGIFVWTGFAYMGESGPFPHKGLNLSFFDLAGFKTPRGHFFECLWQKKPHVYIGTTPAKESEFKYSTEKGFSVELKTEWIRRWDWYDIYDAWNYKTGEEIIVQSYTNCEEVELFLNEKSLGRKSLIDFEDRIIKWIVPFEPGKLKVIGYNDKKAVDEYQINTCGNPKKIVLYADKKNLKPDGKSVVTLEVFLVDRDGTVVTNHDQTIQFNTNELGKIIGVDNGWVYSVENSKQDHVKTHNGKALVIIQAGSKKGNLEISANSGSLKEMVTLRIE